MKKVYIVATPSGRSVISVKDDPRKSLNKTKAMSNEERKRKQKMFKVKLKVKILSISNKIYNQHY